MATKNKQQVTIVKIGILIFVLIIVVVFAESLARLHNAMVSAVFPGMLTVLTNIERQKQGINELISDPLITKAAQMKANDMATKGYFSHISPNGEKPWYWLDRVGYHYDYAGENLALNFIDSKDVTEAWMRSSTHRSNILKSDYTHIGTGVATGTYQGHTAVFIVQFYARPR